MRYLVNAPAESLRGYPKVGDEVLVNGEYIGTLVNKDIYTCRISFLYDIDLKEDDIFSVNTLSKEFRKLLEEEKPHILI